MLTWIIYPWNVIINVIRYKVWIHFVSMWSLIHFPILFCLLLSKWCGLKENHKLRTWPSRSCVLGPSRNNLRHTKHSTATWIETFMLRWFWVQAYFFMTQLPHKHFFIQKWLKLNQKSNFDRFKGNNHCRQDSYTSCPIWVYLRMWRHLWTSPSSL